MSAPNYEQLVNGTQTTLNGTITAIATSLIVTSATGFPTVGNFRLLIDSEIVLVTAVSGTTFTISRAQEGTTGASHTSGVNVTHVFTAGAANSFRADALLNDTFANRPSAGVLGRIFIPSNSDILCYDTGSVWEHFGPLNQWTQPPLVASFSTAATFAGTATDDSGTIYFVSNPQSAAWNICDQYIAKPSTPYTIVANMELDAFYATNGANLAGCGIYIRDSSTGKIVTNNAWWDGSDTIQGIQVSVTEFSNFVTIVSDEVSRHSATLSANNIWMKFTDDGTNRIFSLSNDGRNWTLIDSRSNATYVPATYDQVGFHIVTDGNADWFGKPSMKLRSWKQS